MDNEVEYRLVFGDYGSKEEIGVIAIEYPRDHTVRLEHHWVKFPNGTKRKWYNYREISQSDYDILTSFDSIPKLKVSYREWYKKVFHLGDSMEKFTIIFILASLIWGYYIMLCGIGWGVADEQLTSLLGMIISGSCMTGTIGGFSFLFLCTKLEIRYHRDTDDDLEPRRWQKNYDIEHE